ncbi:MAG: DegT/DnrJ/EryC1/StrS family aminotransferase [Candidatus Abyssobacteria bacterium SURF_17]|uniref:DegT/DnrJ/EryC1/StrS family aminotransferase n=1 Tax=Candidatus Abyssobacteria bacterium SURF_17 TaxID=2093361 RepID=A0A419F027_9BACT|nr:MAG: DegT/DnrJ/EryC1/StrS family aminotransferase [Candidatus Abyssubacteria bacterium SURF_17]
MPSFEEYCGRLKGIWERRWLTNEGELHRELERRLAEYLGVEHLSLFCNGTIALMVALQALRINGGEVITTPFTFPATPHVLYWNGIRPVFCDIDEKTFNLDPSRIEQHISADTKAILAVHVYGTPCDVEAIEEIAHRHGLHVIYDAAHAFGVRHKGESILQYGDLSMLSFHATKLFTTGEGGALVCQSEAQRKRINNLKNFGIADEETVIGPGINGKMNELQAAFGLLALETIEQEIENRRRLAGIYREGLRDIAGISFLEDIRDIRSNYAYFPIIIDEEQFGLSRDELHNVLKQFNIFTRKYFYPLCSHFPCYSALPSSAPSNLPVAERIARQILCLPIYGTLDEEVVQDICTVVRKLSESAHNL